MRQENSKYPGAPLIHSVDGNSKPRERTNQTEKTMMWTWLLLLNQPGKLKTVTQQVLCNQPRVHNVNRCCRAQTASSKIGLAVVKAFRKTHLQVRQVDRLPSRSDVFPRSRPFHDICQRKGWVYAPWEQAEHKSRQVHSQMIPEYKLHEKSNRRLCLLREAIWLSGRAKVVGVTITLSFHTMPHFFFLGLNLWGSSCYIHTA